MRIIFLFVVFFSQFALANFWVSAELGPVWQSRNDVGIPAIGGTRFSLKEVGSGPFLGTRFYAGYHFNKRHSLRLLIAPFSVSAEGTYANNIDFDGVTFIGGTLLTATYQFNSYRLTYDYHFYRSSDWQLALGFTAKIRDAKIGLQQGAQLRENKNVGFVPLLHFSAAYTPRGDWSLLFDIDGLAAPQGRAFDATLQARYQLSDSLEVYAGYRTLEGGAENDTVFTFAWLHYLLAGVKASF